MNDLMREEFEAWMQKVHPSARLHLCSAEHGYRFCIGQYVEIRVQDAWTGWQASRETLVIEMPKPAGLGRMSSDMTMQEIREDNRFNRALDLSVRAIHAAGVKTR